LCSAFLFNNSSLYHTNEHDNLHILITFFFSFPEIEGLFGHS